jgi:FkbM family methyltransferase
LLGRAIQRVLLPFAPPRLQLALSYVAAEIMGCEPELSNIHRIGPNCGVAIDAGANEGLFTFRLARLYKSVAAFEVNTELAARLQRIAPKNAEVHACGLSSSAGESVLHIPVSRGMQLKGWASLEENNCPDSERYITTKVEVRTLDSFELRDVRFVKCDVEGHELQLLMGGRQILSRDRPIVLIEVKEQNRNRVRAFFNELNYVENQLTTLIGIPGTTKTTSTCQNKCPSCLID